MPRRPHLTRTRRGAARQAVLLLVAVVGLASCGAGPLDVTAPSGPAADPGGCARFIGSLPTSLGSEEQREVTPSDAPVRAWGDPALIVTCGVDLPPLTSEDGCDTVNGVDWHVPRAQYVDQESDATLTAVGFRPLVSLQVPQRYRGPDVATALTELAALVKSNLTAIPKDGCSQPFGGRSNQPSAQPGSPG